MVVTHNALTQLDMHLQTYLRGSLVDNVFSSKYCCARLITMTKSALTYHRHRNGSPLSFQVLTAPAKEFKTVNNSISRVMMGTDR